MVEVLEILVLLFYTMVADGLVTQVARASATMVLTYFSQNIQKGELLLFLSVNYVKVFFTDVQILSNTRNIKVDRA